MAVAATEGLIARPRPGRRGADRLTVVLVSLTAFLVVLALLGAQLRAHAGDVAARRVVLVRRIYRTTVIETVQRQGPNAPAVTESVSTSGTSAPVATSGTSAPAAPTTRTS